MLQQWFDQSVGNSRYNALQVTVTERPRMDQLHGCLHAGTGKRRRLQPGRKLRIAESVQQEG